MLNNPGKCLVRTVKVCFRDCTATDATHNCMLGCVIILAVNKLFDLCVWILFMWYQKMKA